MQPTSKTDGSLMEPVMLALSVIFVIYAIHKCNDDQAQEGFRHGWAGHGRHYRHGRRGISAGGWAYRPYLPYIWGDVYTPYVYDYPEDYEIVIDSQGNERVIRRKIKYY